MSTDGASQNILAYLDRRDRGFLAVALVANAGLAVAMTQLPPEQRILGFFFFACVLALTLIAMVTAIRRTSSEDHDQPQFRLKVEQLKDRLLHDQFRPQLIIAIPRGGLVVAGILANLLGDEKVVPVISLTRSQSPGFNNAFNRIDFSPADLDREGGAPARILIVDDFCGSGRTLDEARRFVEASLERDVFVVKTAVISFFQTHGHPIPPSYYVDRPGKPVRDTSGELEEMPD
jgi:hypoxanthine phosphoribosyltransferase